MIKINRILKDPSSCDWFKALKLSDEDIGGLAYDLPSSNSCSVPFDSEGSLLILDNKAIVICYEWESYQELRTSLPLERETLLAAMQFANEAADKAYAEGVDEGKKLAKCELRKWLNS